MRSFENIEFGKQHPVAGQHANDLQGVKKSGILSASTLDISEGLVSTTVTSTNSMRQVIHRWRSILQCDIACCRCRKYWCNPLIKSTIAQGGDSEPNPPPFTLGPHTSGPSKPQHHRELLKLQETRILCAVCSTQHPVVSQPCQHSASQ